MTGPVNRYAIPHFDKALCKGDDSELWFAEDTLNPVREDVELARAICVACLERVKCLAWGLRNEEFGMWGGLTANERRHLKSRKYHRLQHLDTELWKTENGN